MGCFRDHVPVKDADLMRYLGNTSNQVFFLEQYGLLLTLFSCILCLLYVLKMFI